jgi:hypothetical protein
MKGCMNNIDSIMPNLWVLWGKDVGYICGLLLFFMVLV